MSLRRAVGRVERAAVRDLSATHDRHGCRVVSIRPCRVAGQLVADIEQVQFNLSRRFKELRAGFVRPLEGLFDL